MRWRDPPPGVSSVFDLTEVNLSDCYDLMEPVEADRDGCIIVPQEDFLLTLTLEHIALPLDSRLAAPWRAGAASPAWAWRSTSRRP